MSNKTSSSIVAQQREGELSDGEANKCLALLDDSKSELTRHQEARRQAAADQIMKELQNKVAEETESQVEIWF